MNIILGNGVNIHFDEKKDRWKNLAKDCQLVFLEKLKIMKKSQNPFIKSIYLTWLHISKFIDLEKESQSLEGIVKFFSVFNYHVFFNNDYEYKKFLEDLFWLNSKGLSKYMKIERNKYVLEFDLIFCLKANEHLSILCDFYKKSIEEVLMSKYKISKIKVPDYFCEYINKHFWEKISLNYDNNLNCVKNLVKLHGSFDKKILDYKGSNLSQLIQKGEDKYSENVPKGIWSEYVTFVKGNVIEADIILENFSNVKENNLDILNEWKENRLENTLDDYNIPSGYIDPEKVSVEKVTTYDKLLELEGTVVLLGISPRNDENILEYLVKNKKIDKIIVYLNTHKEEITFENPKIYVDHYNNFWDLINL